MGYLRCSSVWRWLADERRSTLLVVKQEITFITLFTDSLSISDSYTLAILNFHLAYLNVCSLFLFTNVKGKVLCTNSTVFKAITYPLLTAMGVVFDHHMVLQHIV